MHFYKQQTISRNENGWTVGYYVKNPDFVPQKKDNCYDELTNSQWIYKSHVFNKHSDMLEFINTQTS